MAAFSSLAILGASALGAAATSSAANKNAKTAQNIANQNQAQIDETQAANDALFKPYVDRGDAAGDALNSFLGLNGQQDQNKAFDRYKNSTGYQFQMQSGTDAINANNATKGLLKSGSALKALNQYGQNVANTYTQNYLGNLQTQQSAGLSAAGSNASSNSNLLGQTVANNNNLGQQQIQSNTDSTNALTNLLGNAVSAYSYGRGQSSYGSAAKPSSLPTQTPSLNGWDNFGKQNWLKD